MTNKEAFYRELRKMLTSDLLSDREREVIQKRFLHNATLGELSRELGITRRRVKQIEGNAALKILQAELS